jgi:hypothetical protein
LRQRLLPRSLRSARHLRTKHILHACPVTQRQAAQQEQRNPNEAISANAWRMAATWTMRRRCPQRGQTRLGSRAPRVAAVRLADPWGRRICPPRRPAGGVAILGNHDWLRGVGAVRRAFDKVLIPCLERGGKTRFWVAGLGDQLAHRLGRGRFRGEDDLPGTLGRVTTDHPVILLAHEPDIFVRVPPRVSLTLAGHTHGGQIPIPLLWPSFVPSRYGACAPLEPFPIPCRGRGFGLRVRPGTLSRIA